jgi:hypothetical protein
MPTINAMTRDELDELAVPEFDPSYLPPTMQVGSGNSYAVTITYSTEEDCRYWRWG